MLIEYTQSAMHQAHYELLPEDKLYYGEIPGFEGVYATAETLEECRDELHSALEEWVLLSIRLGHELPEFNGIRLELPKLERLEVA